MPPTEPAQRSFPVSRYLESLKRLVREKVPPVWVHGVVSQIRESGNYCYLTLAEYAQDDVRPVATLDLFLGVSELRALNRKLDALPQPFRLAPELKVSLRIEADFYVAKGRFQPRVVDIDPVHTLGELALTRQAILGRLEAEGLLARNRSLSLPLLPLRIGLVTSPGSAAHHDFLETLRKSGFAFTVVLAGAKMQGEGCETSILTAIGILSANPALDVVCIVRGGGARTDLVYFDSEALCRAVALSAVPVLTGIGHEVDKSLLDLVAHSSRITPTDCAGMLVEAVALQWHRLQEISAEIQSLVQARLDNARLQNLHAFQRLSRAFPFRLRQEKKRLDSDAQGLRRGPDKLLALHESRLNSKRLEIRQAWVRSSTAALGTLNLAWQRMEQGCRSQVHTARVWIANARKGLLQGPRKILVQASEAIPPRASRLRSVWQVRFQAESDRQSMLNRALKAQDPVRQIARGFSVTRRADGSIVKDGKELNVGDEIRTQLGSSTVRSRVC